ncbi:MAG: AEC family transporter [Rhodospirillaceae bacterium]|nr:AEC family transporter [Rhodospirillaceae bacterium]
MPPINDILAIIAPVMIISLAGYLWQRCGMPFDQNMVAALVINVGTPCLLLNAILANRPDLIVMARISAATILVLVLTGVVAWGILRVAALPVRVFLPAMVFGNTGNVGLPLCLFAFGPAGLALAVAYFATQSVLQFSIGQGIASGQVSARSVFRSPALYAIALGCALIAGDIALPRFLMNSISTVAGLAIPLMLLSLGVSLASLSVVGLRRSVLVSLFCVGGGFAVGLAASWAMGLEGAARGAVVVQSAMPSAVFNYLFAARYDNRPAEVAGIVVISTLLSFLTLPLLMAFVLSLQA